MTSPLEVSWFFLIPNGQPDDMYNPTTQFLRQLGLGVSWLFYLIIMLAGCYILYAAFMIHPW